MLPVARRAALEEDDANRNASLLRAACWLRQFEQNDRDVDDHLGVRGVIDACRRRLRLRRESAGQQVRGRLRVVGDTILVEPMADYCRPLVGAPDPLAIRYTCNGPGSYESIELRLDRRSPAQLSKWTAAYRVQRRREVCTQYAVRDGRQVCVQTTTETYETTESRSGTLQVRRVQ